METFERFLENLKIIGFFLIRTYNPLIFNSYFDSTYYTLYIFNDPIEILFASNISNVPNFQIFKVKRIKRIIPRIGSHRYFTQIPSTALNLLNFPFQKKYYTHAKRKHKRNYIILAKWRRRVINKKYNDKIKKERKEKIHYCNNWNTVAKSYRMPDRIANFSEFKRWFRALYDSQITSVRPTIEKGPVPVYSGHVTTATGARSGRVDSSDS